MKAIGIDIGTTSICLVLYDPENGRIEESAGAPNEFLEGGFRQDADRIVSVIKEKLDWLLDRNADVGVIGVSAQMHGILYVDREGGRSRRTTPGRRRAEKRCLKGWMQPNGSPAGRTIRYTQVTGRQPILCWTNGERFPRGQPAW